MLGPGGFSSARDIAAITVNRWSHGYSYVANSLFDPDDYEETVLKVARQTQSAASPSPTLMPAVTPGCISPSTRPSARCATYWVEALASDRSLRK